MVVHGVGGIVGDALGVGRDGVIAVVAAADDGFKAAVGCPHDGFQILMVVVDTGVQYGDHCSAGVHSRGWRTVCFVLVPAINGHAEITVFIISPLHTCEILGAFGDSVNVIGLCEFDRVQLL